MKKRSRLVAMIGLVMVGCGLPKVDYEMRAGLVIGRETCHSDTTLNAVLISLDIHPAFSNFGKDVSSNGKAYKNVVKTYSPEANRLDSAKRYSFDFYQQDVIANPTCDLSTTNTVGVPQIKIKQIGYFTNQ